MANDLTLGTRVKYDNEGNYMHGMEATVVSFIESQPDEVRVYFETFPSIIARVKTISKDALVALPVEADLKVRDANTSREYAVNERNNLRRAFDQFKTDVREKAIEVQQEQSWCIEGLNGVLADLGLDPYHTTFAGSVSITAYIRVTEVEDLDAAIQAVYDTIAVNAEGYGVDVDISSFEVDSVDLDPEDS